MSIYRLLMIFDDYCRFSHGHFPSFSRRHRFSHIPTDFLLWRQVGDVWLQVEATEPTGLGLVSVRGPRVEEEDE
jgi:hypothetical protein